MARIKTTPTVRFALWALRIYLLVLLTLIGVKFVRVFSNSHKPAGTNPDGTATATATAGQPASH